MKIDHMKSRKGFTLVEVIVVIAMLGVLATAAIPRFDGYIERARIGADQAAVRTLNSMTSLFRINPPTEDQFKDDTKSNEELMQVLVDGGYLASVVEPQSKEAAFTWIFEKEEWYLQFEDSFYIITLADGFTLSKGRLSGSYSGGSKDVVIPASINGASVKEIYQDAFKNKGMVAVAFDDDSIVLRIHARAFLDNSLTSIDFPDTLERIDLWSFKNNDLTEITLPPNLHTIEQRAFEGNDLAQITIGANVTVIQDHALGTHTVEFKQAYEAGGAGTYVWNGDSWVK